MDLPEDFACSIPPSMGPILRLEDGSSQVVWRTDSKTFRFQTNTKFLRGVIDPIYLRRMIIWIQYSMMQLACEGAGETMPSHGPHGKSFNLL